MAKYTREDLKVMQAWNLERKIQVTQTRILEWIQYYGGNIYVSFSGGKDSTVLADLTARLWSGLGFTETHGQLTLAFIDTGLEYPEIKKFVKDFHKWLESKYSIPIKLDILRPKMNFKRVIEKFGYPIVSKRVAGYVYSARKTPNGTRKKFLTGEIPNIICGNGKYKYLLDAPFKISDYCCHKIKIESNQKYQNATNRMPVVATMAEESKNREIDWLKNGCNSFDENKISKPMSFWTEQDVLRYLFEFEIPYCPVYGDIIPVNGQMSLEKDGKLCTTGVDRTGCMFCMFGIVREKSPNRFERMKITHPKQYNYCINGGHYDEKGWIVPDENGLGIGKVLDFLGKPY